MKYSQLRIAYTTLQKFIKMDFNVRDAYAIYRLYQKLETASKFGMQREKALIQQYNGVVKPNGFIEFVHDTDEESRKNGLENMNRFKEALNELDSMEIDESISPIKLSYDAFGEQKVLPSDIMALDGFVVFE